MSGSKTKYYVASSSFPIFNSDQRINQYESAMLDYTANSPIEMSEYMRQYYNTSRLRNYRGFVNWWKKTGNNSIFGDIKSTFYGDATINNVSVANALRPYISLGPNDTFTVYNSELAFFSEDFWIKYLATQQGKANWVYQDTDVDYTIDYPTNSTIKATFSDGRVIEGSLPNYTMGTRFLEISYSIVTKHEEVEEVPPKYDDEGNIIEEGTTITTITYEYKYGYYHYQEYTGIAALDSIIINNGITGTYTFFPVVPLRNNTAWFTGDKANRISDTLAYLETYGDHIDKDEVYGKLQSLCTEGMTQGSINDVDYITLILGVAINSVHQSDLRYMYEFFFNLHTNFAISLGKPPSEVYRAKQANSYWGIFTQNTKNRFEAIGDSDAFYTQFVINCTGSNLNYSYRWGGSDYFEANGQFKPGAKTGEYGVLAGSYEHVWYTHEPERDNEGNLVYINDESGSHISYITVRHVTPFNLTLFCHQIQQNRWHFISFVDLNLQNLIYHGKSINTDAYAAIADSDGLGEITHTFHDNLPSTPGDYTQLTFKYITVQGDLSAAFVVPLEWNTFMEVGTIHQMEIAYGSQYLIFNCWVKKKVKWYQRGFLSVVFSFVGVVIGAGLAAIMPIIGHTVFTFFSVAFVMTLSAWALETTLKILQAVFGEQLGLAIYNFFRDLLGVVVSIIGKIPVIGWVIAAAIMFSVASGEALNAGDNLWEAFLKGSVAGGMAAVGSYGGQYLGTVAQGAAQNAGITAGTAEIIGNAVSSSVSGAANAFGSSIVQGDSFGEALLSGLTSGVLSGVGSIALDIASDFLSTQNLIENTASGTVNNIKEQAINASKSFNFVDDILFGQIIENPFTYGKLLGMVQDAVNFHKLANLENDYQEFNNQAQAAQTVLNTVMSQQDSTVTAEFVCKLQANIGRVLTQFPDMLIDMSPDSFLTMALSCDTAPTVLQSVSQFTESKLSITGYSPEILYYNQTNFGFAS